MLSRGRYRWLGLCSAAVHDVSHDFLVCVGAERVETVVGQACVADCLNLTFSLIVCLTKTGSLQGMERGKKRNARCREMVCSESNVAKTRLEMAPGLTSCLQRGKEWRSSRIEGFHEHISMDGSLKRVSGRVAACGWAGGAARTQ